MKESEKTKPRSWENCFRATKSDSFVQNTIQTLRLIPKNTNLTLGLTFFTAFQAMVHKFPTQLRFSWDQIIIKKSMKTITLERS